MTILQHTPLIADAPAEILLVLGIFFTLAALILALATVAYTSVRAAMSSPAEALSYE